MHKYFFIALLFFSSFCFAQDDFDPTKPTLPSSTNENYGGSSSNSHGVYLNGIVAKAITTVVILNGKVLQVGDSIEGYKVIAITKDSVTLKPSNSNSSKDIEDAFELKLSNLNFKQPHINSR